MRRVHTTDASEWILIETLQDWGDFKQECEVADNGYSRAELCWYGHPPAFPVLVTKAFCNYSRFRQSNDADSWHIVRLKQEDLTILQNLMTEGFNHGRK